MPVRSTFTLGLSVAGLAAVIWMNWASAETQKILTERHALSVASEAANPAR